MIAVALVHCTSLMLDRLPEEVPKHLPRGERVFAYPHKDWRKPRSWCLTVFTDAHERYDQRSIIGIGSAFPGRRTGTYERTLIVRDFTLLRRTLPLHSLEHLMGVSRRFLHDDGRMSDKAGQRLLESVRNLRPELGHALDALEEDLSAEAPGGPAGERLTSEKDAVGVLFETFGADRDPLAAWSPALDEQRLPRNSAPFLAGMPWLRHIEDQQIAYDYQRFPGMIGEDGVEIGWRVYRRSYDSPHRLFVYNANRTSVEAAMGVDMVYVNEQASSIAMVQYKRMRQSGHGWAYWHDVGGARQLDRMLAIDHECEKRDECLAADFRLIHTPNMVKLCRDTPFTMNSSTLLQGMYLKRQHFEELLSHPDAEGPSGGKRVLESSVTRHLNNTTFTTLLKDGWIGTRGTSTDYVVDLIRQSLSSDGPGSVVVGVHRSDAQPGNRRRW
ncbi:hypothetical protein [Streptomyces sp. RK75]|uniref:hypothetical protein n=1 Tax=Streptomyces sp. RK75 TaxID=2824895 RepID=UPI001B38BA38|nr:hypothetical protein [Streptomyces sp. RK75]MBQ0866359.1 hypothetical protein [Streptomyces sp. RK75]